MLVMSCNVVGGLRDLWPCSLEVLLRTGADLIGFQELYREQLAFYLAGMPDYAAFSTLDRPDIGSSFPTNGIFYRKNRFKVLSAGAYWLSETPHVCGSSSWGSGCVRLLNWMVLEDVSCGGVFVCHNTHLDHISQLAREKQARMINEAAAAYPPGMPQILLGDMNSGASNPVIQSFSKKGWRDTYPEANGVQYQGISWHGLEGDSCQRAQDVPGNEKGAGRIDWIFVRGALVAKAACVVKDTDSQGQLPSDHYFVSAEVDILNQSG